VIAAGVYRFGSGAFLPKAFYAQTALRRALAGLRMSSQQQIADNARAHAAPDAHKCGLHRRVGFGAMLQGG
jgi:hypothetical protein